MSVRTQHPEEFVGRHIGPRDQDVAKMLQVLKVDSLESLMDQTIPASIRRQEALSLPAPLSESAMLQELEGIAAQNQPLRSLIGMGYSDTITPPVILRNIVQNPGWYTQYTPYQAEIAQGRLEALLNYQTMIIDLTGLEVANASLLDEGTSAAEAMHMMYEFSGNEQRNTIFLDSGCHPQTIDVVASRARAIGVDVEIGDVRSATIGAQHFGVLLQYPSTDGGLWDPRGVIAQAHAAGALVTVAADLLSLALVASPGELGADVAVGSSQRFGVPLGFGGPHAAFFATKNDFVRKMPGRIIGVSQDAQGRRALRMALQTREQHIRREKATSNVCTAQALLAIVAGMYACYHGPEGIKAIAEHVHGLTVLLAEGLKQAGISVTHGAFFDTVRVDGTEAQVQGWMSGGEKVGFNLRRLSSTALTIALDETVSFADVASLLTAFGWSGTASSLSSLAEAASSAVPATLARQSAYLTHPVFNQHRSETQLLRYMRTLESRDLSLTHSMIPLGSCTMKLNATAEMIPITWAAFNRVHPFAPLEQSRGYLKIFADLEAWLAEITGFPGISLQPNAGSQGEYAGLLVIRRYHEVRGEGHRTVCLIPSSAHGTNPASAVMAGFQVVVVACDAGGNIDVADLKAKAEQHSAKLAALMVTYPSTHGVFEEAIKEICEVIHSHGGQVYMDGANMNAQVGLCRPGDIGADVCHLNLHKTFCIPHGGGGPGMGPIGVAAHLKAYLPGHPVVELGHSDAIGAISAAPWGSASILLISWAYIRMMGGAGLTRATQVAILNANYIADRLEPYYRVFYRGAQGRVAHECILDMRHFKKTAGIEVDDIAKRLMDYGFHAPTMSFPIPSTMMVEPTESEDLGELDRFCDAMISIRQEIQAVEEGLQPREGNVLRNSPHTAHVLTGNEWPHPYTRNQAAFPLDSLRSHKFWPAVGRINNALGDRKLICSCPPIEDYQS